MLNFVIDKFKIVDTLDWLSIKYNILLRKLIFLQVLTDLETQHKSGQVEDFLSSNISRWEDESISAWICGQGLF